MTKVFLQYICITSIFLYIGGSIANAQDSSAKLELAVAPEAFIESYTPRTKVSGYTLVGLSYNTSTKKFNPSRVQLALEEFQTQQPFICAKTTSNDGQYWSQNPYKTPSSIVPHPKFEVMTVNFKKELSRYQLDDMYILASTNEISDCNSTNNSVFLPILGDTTHKNTINMVINTQGRKASARIYSKDKNVIAQATCSVLTDGPRISADKMCTFNLPTDARTGIYEIELRMRSRLTKSAPEFYKVFIDGK